MYVSPAITNLSPHVRIQLALEGGETKSRPNFMLNSVWVDASHGALVGLKVGEGILAWDE